MTSYLNAGHIHADTLIRIIEVSRQLNSMTDIDVLLNEIIRTAADLIGSQAASLLLYDKKMGHLRFKAAVGERSAELENLAVPLKGSVAGQIFLKNEPIMVNDVAATNNWHSEYDQEIEFRTKDILGVPLRDSSSNPVGVLEAINKLHGHFTQSDSTVLSILGDLAGVAISKAQLFDELQSAYDKVNELDRLKSDFIALASHELRTPLSIIMGYMSFIRTESQGTQAEQIDHMMRAAVRLRNLIQDMLNLQYVDAGDTQLEKNLVDINEVIKSIVKDRAEAALNKRLVFKLHLPSEPLYTLAEPQMLEVIISNLVDNAFKFTPSGGRIDVGAANRDDELWLYVRDTGIGIPADQLERIFDRFYQVEPHMHRRFEGMGLGLSIVKELVELHEGRVWAQSVEGKGSEFFVVLKSTVN